MPSTGVERPFANPADEIAALTDERDQARAQANRLARAVESLAAEARRDYAAGDPDLVRGEGADDA